MSAAGHGISEATYCAWKAKFGGIDISDARQLRALEEENGKLKWLLADAMLDNTALKDLLVKMATLAARREAVAYLCQVYEVSRWRACNVIEADLTSVRYQARRPDDAALRARLREMVGLRRCSGYRRLYVLLKHKGVRIYHKNLRRSYAVERL